MLVCTMYMRFETNSDLIARSAKVVMFWYIYCGPHAYRISGHICAWYGAICTICSIILPNRADSCLFAQWTRHLTLLAWSEQDTASAVAVSHIRYYGRLCVDRNPTKSPCFSTVYVFPLHTVCFQVFLWWFWVLLSDFDEKCPRSQKLGPNDSEDFAFCLINWPKVSLVSNECP